MSINTALQDNISNAPSYRRIDGSQNPFIAHNAISTSALVDGTISASSVLTSTTISDKDTLSFEDGYSVTGKELRLMLKVLKDLTKDTLPEEFI